MRTASIYWVWLRMRTKPASTTAKTVLSAFEDPEAVFHADQKALSEVEGLKTAEIASLCDKGLDDVQRVLDACARYGIGIITMEDSRYPARLKQINDPPVLLFYQGKSPDLVTRPAVSMVGTRQMSEYGKRMAYELAYGLSSAGVTVISGMALGIDSVAAAGAIATGGVTIAVFGNGVTYTYPRQHQRLREEICRKGAVLSEYLPWEGPDGSYFPQRNRIISALGQGVVVVEGPAKSGTMITARRAMEQGFPIFVLPGNVDEPNSYCANTLLKEGAHPISSAADILDALGYYDEAVRLPKNVRPSVDVMVKRLGIAARVYRNGKEISPLSKVNPLVKRSSSVKQHTAEEAPRSTAQESVSATVAHQPTDPVFQGLSENVVQTYFRMPVSGEILPDAIATESCPTSQVLGCLTILEVKGLVERCPGGRFRRKQMIML